MKTIVFTFILGTSEIIIIVFTILLLFGGKKIPQLMRGIGQSIKAFNDGKNKDEI